MSEWDDTKPRYRFPKPPPGMDALVQKAVKFEETKPGVRKEMPRWLKFLHRRRLLALCLLLAAAGYLFHAERWLEVEETVVVRQAVKAAERPARKWAREHVLTYEDVAGQPTAFPEGFVYWQISRAEEGFFYYGTDPSKTILWSQPGHPDLAFIPRAGGPVWVLAGIEPVEGPAPTLSLLVVDGAASVP